MSLSIPSELWHGTDAEPFDAFDQEKIGPWKFGHWFSDDAEYADLFGTNVARVSVTLVRPYVLSSERWDRLRDAHHGDHAWFAVWRKKLEAEGYDGLLVEPKVDHLKTFVVRSPCIVAVFDAARISIIDWNMPRPSP